MQGAESPPRLEFDSAEQETLHQRLVIAAQADGTAPDHADGQRVDHRAGMRPAVDIVAEIDLDGVPDRPARQVFVDSGKSFRHEIGAAMNITDGIDARVQRRYRDRCTWRCTM